MTEPRQVPRTALDPGEDSISGILPGFSLPPALRPVLHEKLGRELTPDAYTGVWTGSRVLVAPTPVTHTAAGGLLWKPQSVIERQQMAMGSGWVVAVGPTVGQPGALHPGGVLCDHPTDLLGHLVIYAAYSGTAINTCAEDQEFGGANSLLVMTDRDILHVSTERLGVPNL